MLALIGEFAQQRTKGLGGKRRRERLAQRFDVCAERLRRLAVKSRQRFEHVLLAQRRHGARGNAMRCSLPS